MSTIWTGIKKSIKSWMYNQSGIQYNSSTDPVSGYPLQYNAINSNVYQGRSNSSWTGVSKSHQIITIPLGTYIGFGSFTYASAVTVPTSNLTQWSSTNKS